MDFIEESHGFVTDGEECFIKGEGSEGFISDCLFEGYVEGYFE